MKIVNFTPVLFFLAFTGCSSTSGVMQLSADTYMISKTSAGGAFASQTAMQAEVIKEANEFASKQGKVAVTRGMQFNRPPVGFPTVEYQFELMNPKDPRAAGIYLKPKADFTIEREDKLDANIRTKNETSEKADLFMELTKLDSLRKQGVLTEEEFTTQKQKLLKAN